MKESHRKGVANHPDLESCVRHREVAGEAQTEALAGRVSGFVKLNWDADLVRTRGKPHGQQVANDFQERLAKFGLELHPDKTRLIEFGRNAAANRQKRGEEKPETFDFLGFTHYCGSKKGRFVVWRKTAGKRMRAKLQQIKRALLRRMHEPIAQIGGWLGKVLQGYDLYHAVPGNNATLGRGRHGLQFVWWQVLRRRSQRLMKWERHCAILDRWLPFPRILHPYPSVRFDATHPRRSRMR